MSEPIYPNEWDSAKLADVAKVSFSNVDKKTTGGEKEVLLCNYMDVYDNEHIDNSITFMPATAKDREIEKFLLQKGDVLTTKDSETPDDIAISAFVSEQLQNVLCGYHLALIRPNQSRLYGEFLSDLFMCAFFRKQFTQKANGSTRFGLTTDVYTRCDVPLPPLPEQRKIAAILSSVDRSIETTERMIGKLEDLKKAMMQELLTHGLPPATAAKHGIPKSGKFKASAVGQIPEEWEVVRLGDVVDVVGGGTPSSKENAYWNGDLPWANPTDITALNVRYIRETNRYITETGLSKSSAKLLPVGTVVMTSRATIGYTAINLVPMATNQGFQSLICGDKVYNEFLHYLISECRDKLTNIAAGSTFREISSSEVRIYQIKLPPMSEQKTIASILTSIDTRIAKARQRRDKLQALKKGLMQDLLTGRVRVGRCPALPWQARCGGNS